MKSTVRYLPGKRTDRRDLPAPGEGGQLVGRAEDGHHGVEQDGPAAVFGQLALCQKA